jgi:hypothetical protein
MFAVAIGIGYTQLSDFYIKYPSFFWYPIATVIFNIVFGFLSIYMLIDAYSQKNRLGSF